MILDQPTRDKLLNQLSSALDETMNAGYDAVCAAANMEELSNSYRDLTADYNFEVTAAELQDLMTSLQGPVEEFRTEAAALTHIQALGASVPENSRGRIALRGDLISLYSAWWPRINFQ